MKDSQAIAVLTQLKANTKQLQKQNETFVHAMERLEEVNQRFTEVNQRLTDMQSEISDVRREISDIRREMRQLNNKPDDKPDDKPRPPTHLAVTMPNGAVVKRKDASDTFVEVIRRIGKKRVKDLNLKVNRKDLMSTSEDYQQRIKLGGYYINVGTSTDRKKRLLEDIASRLDVRLDVKIIPK